MMKSACERKLRKRWSFLDRVFRTRPDKSGEKTAGHETLPGTVKL